MQPRDGQMTFSPSDLNAFLACPHLAMLQLAVARGEIEKPYRVNRHADLIRAKGDEHEADVLASLGDGVVSIERWLRRCDAAAGAAREGLTPPPSDTTRADALPLAATHALLVTVG